MKRTGAHIDEIHHEEEIVHEEMHHAAIDLEICMFVGTAAFAFPVRQLTIYMFTKFTDRPWRYKFDDYFDMLLAILVAWWVERFYTYSHTESTDKAIATTPEEIFMYKVIQGINSGEFHFDFLLASVAGMFWLRVLLMLKLTKTFGPMIKIITTMLGELATFSMLWVIQLFIFACLGTLIFADIPEFDNFYDTMVMLFETSMGEWDLNIYNDLVLGKEVGEVYHILVIILNLILLLNLVIAILSETYARFSRLKLGLYYDGVVDAIPSYKYDKRYGAMICAVPPFNVIMIPFTPLFYCIKNPKRLRTVNKYLSMFAYAPIACIMTVIFTVVNVLLMPPAYVFAVIHKIKLVVAPRIYRSRSDLIKDLIFFIFFGVGLLSLSQFTDAYYFMKHLFYWNAQKLDGTKVDSISIAAFSKLEEIVKRETTQLHGEDSKTDYKMPTINLIKILREELEIQRCIQTLIFGKFLPSHDFKGKVITHVEKTPAIAANANEPKSIATESPLTRIKIFNLIKKVI